MRVAILALLLLYSGCVTRQEVEAVIWLNNFNDQGGSLNELCANVPELKQRGFYRKLDLGKYELVSVCNPIARDFLIVHKDDLARLLDKALPKPQP